MVANTIKQINTHLHMEADNVGVQTILMQMYADPFVRMAIKIIARCINLAALCLCN